MTILISLFCIIAILAVHEMGHYIALRSFGIPVLTFSVGWGRPLFSFTDRRQTKWQFCLLLLGGYVKSEASAHDAAEPWKKLVIAVAGPLANIFPVFVVALFFGHPLAFFGMLGHLFVMGANDALYAISFHLLGDGSGASLGGILLEVVRMNESPLLKLFDVYCFMSLMLGLINMMPIPMLDGGRAVMALIEWTFGRARTLKFEKVAGVFGALTLLLYIISPFVMALSLMVSHLLRSFL